MKMWEKPMLIVLVRSAREEAVLTPCKSTVVGPAGPSPEDSACTMSGIDILCTMCNTLAAS